MMQDLAIKAKQEKYFNSIRYFGHTLSFPARKKFILEVANHNIYLAAQCVMSAEEDLRLEKILKKRAESMAKDFSNTSNSALGFLALAEFESFEVILSLFSSLKSIGSLHNRVIASILGRGNPTLFYKFLDILCEVSQPHLIENAISVYNGEVRIDSTNRMIFKKVFDRFLKNGHYGTLRLVLSKFMIGDEYSYISEQNLEESIHRFLRIGKYTSINLAYELVISNRLIEKHPPEEFIKHYLKITSNKGIIASIRLAEKYDLGKIDEVEQVIRKRIFHESAHHTIKKRPKRIRNFLKKGSADYIKKYFPELYKKAIEIILEYEKDQYEKQLRRQTFIAGISPNMNVQTNLEFERLIDLQQKQDALGKNETIASLRSIFTLFFNTSTELRLEPFIELVLKYFDTSLSQVKAVLRKFIFKGVVEEIKDFGVVIRCEKLKQSKRLFISKKKLEDLQIPESDIEAGYLIYFMIVDLNNNFSIKPSLNIVKDPAKRIVID